MGSAAMTIVQVPTPIVTKWFEQLVMTSRRNNTEISMDLHLSSVKHPYLNHLENADSYVIAGF